MHSVVTCQAAGKLFSSKDKIFTEFHCLFVRLRVFELFGGVLLLLLLLDTDYIK